MALRQNKPATRRVTTPSADLPELLTISEFMEAARVKRTSAYQMAREGKIPIVRIGRSIRVPRSVLEARV